MYSVQDIVYVTKNGEFRRVIEAARAAVVLIADSAQDVISNFFRGSDWTGDRRWATSHSVFALIRPDLTAWTLGYWKPFSLISSSDGQFQSFESM